MVIKMLQNYGNRLAKSVIKINKTHYHYFSLRIRLKCSREIPKYSDM